MWALPSGMVSAIYCLLCFIKCSALLLTDLLRERDHGTIDVSKDRRPSTSTLAFLHWVNGTPARSLRGWGRSQEEELLPPSALERWWGAGTRRLTLLGEWRKATSGWLWSLRLNKAVLLLLAHVPWARRLVFLRFLCVSRKGGWEMTERGTSLGSAGGWFQETGVATA